MLARQIERQPNSQPKSWFLASEDIALYCHSFSIETAGSRTKQYLRWPRLHTTS